MGVLTLYRLRHSPFSADDQRLLMAIAPKAGLAIQNALRFERAESDADTDELTGLPNARYLFSYLQSEVESAADDRYGHLAGNRILHSVARSLRQNCRAGESEETLARID